MGPGLRRIRHDEKQEIILTVIEGKREQLVGKIQERYGYQKEAAEKEVKSWEDHNKYRW
ncbi:hypothetical protein SPRA44_750056 [Serratia proteamaculans]|nr:hypothetical protein SPRA44_750056 [Serratia proteamaculans]